MAPCRAVVRKLTARRHEQDARRWRTHLSVQTTGEVFLLSHVKSRFSFYGNIPIVYMGGWRDQIDATSELQTLSAAENDTSRNRSRPPPSPSPSL